MARCNKVRVALVSNNEQANDWTQSIAEQTNCNIWDSIARSCIGWVTRVHSYFDVLELISSALSYSPKNEILMHSDDDSWNFSRNQKTKLYFATHEQNLMALFQTMETICRSLIRSY
jgi:hypothetical protein